MHVYMCTCMHLEEIDNNGINVCMCGVTTIIT